MRGYFFHSDVLVDRPRLAKQLPAAWARTLAAHRGGQIDNWQAAYQQVVDDWGSYWADLTLSETDPLAQWREGWWRIIRAVYRLAGEPPPSLDALSFHLDELPDQVGRYCSAWRSGAADVLQTVTRQGHKAAIISPYTAAPLVRGMLAAAALDQHVVKVLGPDELGQVGLHGINWRRLADQVGFDPNAYRLVSDEAIPDVDMISSPADLLSLVNLLE
jgi:hypothetical protein